jgi:putative nucleotidyltransferase with HDIG domain
MRLVSINNSKAGMILARPIYNGNGKLLVAEGMTLNERFISRFKDHGIGSLYIKDKVTDDIIIEDVIPLEVRVQAMETIKSTFSNIKKNKGRVSDVIKVDGFKQMIHSILKGIQSSNRAIALLSDIHITDHYVYAHSLNVMIYTLGLAIEKGFNDEQLCEISLGCLLHDIGKMMIPKEILYKPGKLSDAEFEVIKNHPLFGFEILRKQEDIPLLAAHCALQHHEKWDGSGYPYGLKGENIHPYARLIAVADVFDALTSNRSYRNAMLPHEAMDIIYAETHSHFEQEAVEIFRKKIVMYPIGLTVQLSTGETGVVVDNNAHFTTRPIVRIFRSASGETLQAFTEIDLSKNLSIMIVGCEAIL